MSRSPTLRPRAAGIGSVAGREAGIEPRRDPAAVLAASTFSAGMLLLPPQLRRDARRLYKVLRTIDDLVDEQHPDAARRLDAVEQWVAGGAANTSETVALESLCESYPIPLNAIQGFCQGMRHDLEGQEIETEADFKRYCLQAGGTVGVMVCGLLGTCHPDAERKMEMLGVATQWTNILRDIDEDLASGRVYIPKSVIERFGFPHPGHREQLLRDQIPRADAFFAKGMTAIELLARGQRAIGVSGILYREILRQIEREGYGRQAGRVSVPRGRAQKLVSTYQVPQR